MSAIALADQPTSIINESNVRGVHDVTVLSNGRIYGMPTAANPYACVITQWNGRPFQKILVFGGTRPLSYNGNCHWTDVKAWEAKFAEGIRGTLGDKGRH